MKTLNPTLSFFRQTIQNSLIEQMKRADKIVYLLFIIHFIAGISIVPWWHNTYQIGFLAGSLFLVIYSIAFFKFR